LRPVDKRRWCAGSYVGEVTYERRVACGDRIDEGVCSEPTSVGGSASALSRRRSLSSG
jgi:hypothetical protein